MVSATTAVDFGSTSKLAEHNYEGAIKHPLMLQILNQRSDCALVGRKLLIETLEDVGVMVPASFV